MELISKVYGCCSPENEYGYAVKVFNDFDKAKELIGIGWDAWISAAEDDEEFLDTVKGYFTLEEREWVECSGYIEPTEELLKRNNICYEFWFPWSFSPQDNSDDEELINSIDEMIRE